MYSHIASLAKRLLVACSLVSLGLSATIVHASDGPRGKQQAGLNRNSQQPGTPGSVKIHPASHYREQVIIFKVLPAYREQCSNNSVLVGSIQKIITDLGGGSVTKMFPHHKAPTKFQNERGEALIDLSLVYEFRYSTKTPVADACNQMLLSGAVQYAEPWYIYAPVFTANDPSIAQQYHINRIRANAAWDITQGDTSVVIGIVDSGVDWDHPDMAANIKINYADPIDGVDNDNNGFIDDYRGWDFGGAAFANIVPDNNPMVMGNNNNHGSHVSGIAGGVTNNGVGMAGVGFKCKILGLKCSADNDTRAGGAGFIINGYGGITYAADNGADVINCSWGGQGFASSFEQDVIDYATINKNALVVAAAGNNNSEADFYPAYLDKVLSVASTTTSDAKSSFSNLSYKVSISAPGSNIQAAIFNNGYGALSGTSMASPVVAGCAALVKSQFPTFGPREIAATLRATADNIYTIAANRNFAGKLGSGRVNVFRAVTLNSPGVSLTTRNISDGNDGIFASGDTVTFTGTYLNALFPSTQRLRVKLTSLAPTVVSMIQDSSVLGVLNTGQSIVQGQPFKMRIMPGATSDRVVAFRLDILDSNNYRESVYFEFMINQSFINVRKNNIKTTITSNGRIGYSGDQATQGIGFLYRDIPTLFEMGVLTSLDATTVGDCIRDDAQGYRKTFSSDKNVFETLSPTVGNYNIDNKFSATAAVVQPNISVKQRTYVWGTAADSNYIIVAYNIQNKSATTMTGLNYGIFSDFDISTNGATDVVKWERSVNMGYVKSNAAGGHFAGIGLLSPYAKAFTPITNDGTAGSRFQIYDGFTLAEKHLSLSSGVDTSNTVGAAAGQDVSMVAGYGPLTLAPGDSVTLLFALAAAPDLTTLVTSVGTAVTKTPIIVTGLGESAVNNSALFISPNPASRWLRVTGLMGEQMMPASLVNTKGQIVFSTSINPQDPITQLPDLTPGIYMLRVAGRSFRVAISQ